MMKHAFLIQVHAYPEQLREIVTLLEADNHYFFINVDKKVCDKPFRNALANFDNVFFAEGNHRTRVNHAGFSQIRCTVQLLKMAQKMDMDYVHTLSGQDFPCIDNKSFDKFFENCNNRSFMHYDSPEQAIEWSKKKYPERYRRYYAYDFPGRNYFLIKALVILLNNILRILPKRKVIANIVAGWSWFTWHKTVVNYVLSYLNDNSNFYYRFKYTSCCDEVIFHTILNGLEKELNIDRYNSLRFVEWHPKRFCKSLPLVLNEQEYEDIIESKAFFCRKIHPVESRKLKDMLRKYIQANTLK